MKEQFKIPINSPSFGKEELREINKVFESNWPSEGKITKKFEMMISKYLSSNAVVVNNGSSALMSAMIANNIKPGEKVIVPDFTFVATSSIPKLLGAEIITADIDQNTFNIKAENVEEIVKKEDVKAVILVDVAGIPTDIDAFTDLAKRHKFILIEDAAQSFSVPIDIDVSRPLGRVDIALLENGDSVVSWLRKNSDGTGEISIRKISAEGIVGPPHIIAETSASMISGFPQMVRSGDYLFFAWTDTSDQQSRILTARLAVHVLSGSSG